MIPQEIFYALILIDVGLIVYPFLSLENRVYANVITAFGASVLSLYLAVNAITGNVFIYEAVTNTTTAATVGDLTTTTYTILDSTYAIQNAPIMWLFILLGLVMGAIALVMMIEAIMQNRVTGEAVV